MNSLLLEIFPEAVANTIFKVCIHPLADAFILGARERLLHPFLEGLKELKTQLHEWEISEDPLKVALKYWGYRDIDTLDTFGHELRRGIKFIEPQCNNYVERINKKRHDDANEDVWYTFLQTYYN